MWRRVLLAALVAALVASLACYIAFRRSTKRGVFDSIARIPYSSLLSNDPSIRKDLFQSMREFGIFFVQDIPSYNASSELLHLKHFFALPLPIKMEHAVRKHNGNNINVYRGYGPLSVNQGTQFKETFNIGPHEVHPAYNDSGSALERMRSVGKERNVWPRTGEPEFDERFKELFTSGFALRRSIALATIRTVCRHLKFPHLIDLFTHHEFSTLGLRKYPLRTSINKGTLSSHDDVLLTELEHVDSTVTVLSTFNNTGLQALYKGQYWDVPVSGDGFLINIGTLVEDMTDGEIISVRHRVIQIDKVRYSIPFFFNPSFDADISRSMSGKLTKAGEKYRTFGEWMSDYLPRVEPGLLKPAPSQPSQQMVEDQGQLETDQAELDDAKSGTLARLTLN
uniref:Putative isopenicillin-n-synthase n=1 Tax=Ctenophora sp. B WRF-2014 TaxID=1567048 RepID=A0A0A0RVU6_9METZ|nr:putative isopenicillin-n-synthase [Ctenophora sp. B WRF-2014]